MLRLERKERIWNYQKKFQMTKTYLKHINKHIKIKEQIRNRKYKPSLVRRVYISKDNGDKRVLGIPIVVDRVIQ